MDSSDYDDRYFVPVENAKKGEVGGRPSSTYEGGALGQARWSGRWMQTPASPFSTITSTRRGNSTDRYRSTLEVIENDRYRRWTSEDYS